MSFTSKILIGLALGIYISTWVDMTSKNGTLDRLFMHWIDGGGTKPEEPRWSAIRNKLQWVE